MRAYLLSLGGVLVAVLVLRDANGVTLVHAALGVVIGAWMWRRGQVGIGLAGTALGVLSAWAILMVPALLHVDPAILGGSSVPVGEEATAAFLYAVFAMGFVLVTLVGYAAGAGLGRLLVTPHSRGSGHAA